MASLKKMVVADQRIKRILFELQSALAHRSGRQLAALVAVNGARDFVGAVFRRGENLVSLCEGVVDFGVRHSSDAADAWGKNQLAEFVAFKADLSKQTISDAYGALRHKVEAISADPVAELVQLAAFAIVALLSSGGGDGDGGLPDIDIPLLGIGAHRSPLTHSILIGAGAESLVAGFLRLSLDLYKDLPECHDPIWDCFHLHAPQLLAAVSKGISAGLAYHLLVDGLAQPAPYHGLPGNWPIEVHQALQAVNGITEGSRVFDKTLLHPKTAETVAQHRETLATPFAIEPELEWWIGERAFAILKKDGSWMWALATHELKPYSQSQLRFVATAHLILPPQTDHEIAWLCYLNVLRIAQNLERSQLPLSRSWRRLQTWIS